MKTLMKQTFSFVIFCIALFAAPFVYASTTDGTIGTTDRYAWSENVGWLDFGTTLGAIHVTDSALTGYAYGENIGWISLNCSNTSTCADNAYAVTNNSEGTLSGYAWGENTGWINFAPAQGGVSISSAGVFSGYAYSENLGWLVFATDHPVTTDWRPASSRNSVTLVPAPVVSSNGPPVPANASPASLPGYKAPRNQIIYPDGRVVYLDEPTVTAPVTPPSTSALPVFVFTKNRKQNDRGEDIRTLQKFLNAHGFIIAKSGSGSVGKETSIFGAATVAALKKLQASIHLPATGYFGPQTRAYINSH